MKCGHCKEKHETVAQVRDCSVIASTVVIMKPVVFEPVTEPGMYRTEGQVYLVVKSENGHLYAKRLVAQQLEDGTMHKLTFEYDKGSIFKIATTDRMSVEDVAQLGKTSGHCWVCARKLTVQKSIQAGIGPVCAKKV